MYVVEKLKLNKFQNVEIPTPEEYIRRFGFQVKPLPHSGDEIAPVAMSKIQSLGQVARDNTQALRLEYAKSQESAPVESAPAPAPAESTPTPTE